MVFTSDHGEEFWEHGGVLHGVKLFEESVRVPLIIRYPKAVPVASRVFEAVSLVDVAPTLLELADIPAPYSLDGISLLQPVSPERAVRSMLELDGMSWISITRPPWKLIWDRRRRTKELYNLELDAPESWDLARRHPDRVDELTRELVERAEANAARRAAFRQGDSRAPVRQEDLPEDARQALEALGYVQPKPEKAEKEQP